MSLDGQTRIDRVLPELFAELASPHTPDYLEAAIDRASSRRQRPAWTYPGRWLPVEITTKAAPPARVPWREIGILTLIALLLATAAVVFVGSRPRVPAPFGLAANGAVAIERGGDILAVDPATGTTTPIVTGPEIDSAPAYSPDGTRIAFQRSVDGNTAASQLMVANADGSGLLPATPEPFSGLHSWRFSPSGEELLVTSVVGGQPQLSIVTIDGSRPLQPIDIQLTLNDSAMEVAEYRPPDGREILVVTSAGGGHRGIHAVDVETGQTRTIIDASPDFDVFGAAWSPTGDRITYHRFEPRDGGSLPQPWIVAADGTNNHPLAIGREAAIVDSPTGLSNDGSRLLVSSATTPDGADQRYEVVPADGSGPPVELQCDATGTDACPGAWTWSPDDTVLLGAITNDAGAELYVLADPATGVVTPLNWGGEGMPSWQRLAP